MENSYKKPTSNNAQNLTGNFQIFHLYALTNQILCIYIVVRVFNNIINKMKQNWGKALCLFALVIKPCLNTGRVKLHIFIRRVFYL